MTGCAPPKIPVNPLASPSSPRNRYILSSIASVGAIVSEPDGGIDTKLNDDNHLLFVYGTLLNAAKRVILLGRPINAIPARLPGYTHGKSRFHFVAKQTGAITDGAILEGLTAQDLTILDDYEEVPRLYIRTRVEVHAADNRKIECWIYLPTSWANE